MASVLSRGEYVRAGSDAARSPCPVINSLANHGYIPRDGKNIRAAEFYSALSTVGLSRTLRAALSYPIYNVHIDPQQPTKKLTILEKLWKVIRNPLSVLAIFGMRRPDQVDERGRKTLDLDQFAIHGAVEHDVSLSRRDYLQKEGDCKLQPDLLRQLLDCSKDGRTITIKDLADLRKLRIQQQMKDNPGLEYGTLQHTLGCGEIALILSVFGNGDSIPCSYVRALFEDERLPVEEGWKRRWWWTVGLVELQLLANKVKALVGFTSSAKEQ